MLVSPIIIALILERFSLVSIFGLVYLIFIIFASLIAIINPSNTHIYIGNIEIGNPLFIQIGSAYLLQLIFIFLDLKHFRIYSFKYHTNEAKWNSYKNFLTSINVKNKYLDDTTLQYAYIFGLRDDLNTISSKLKINEIYKSLRESGYLEFIKYKDLFIELKLPSLKKLF